MSLRVLIAVTHLLGVGHLTRAAALARALAARGHAVTLVSGGLPAPLVDTTGVRLVQLPAVRIEGTAFSNLLTAQREPVTPAHLEERRSRLLAAFEEAAPDAVVTELYPFGRRVLADEFDALLAAAAARRPRPAILASLRDILVAPGKPERLARTHDVAASRYDGLLVHGDSRIVPLEASWPLEAALRPLVVETGYVSDGRSAHGPGGGDGDILVSGGGSAASLPLYRAALEAARSLDHRSWRVLVGSGVGEDEFRALQREAPGHVAVERGRSDFPALLAACAVSVSQAGYNTVVDLARAGCRAVLVPFEAGHETEQRLRAERLAARGLAHVLPEADLTGARLAAAVGTALAGPPPGPGTLSVDGAERSARAIERAAGVGADERAFARLRIALARLAARGRPVDVWWRDDDAVEAGPALDRLIALAREHRIPLALAVIPALARESLARRIEGEDGLALLVHGFSHANHAPAGEKKAEFAAGRPLDALRDDAARGLAAMRHLFGARALPVFVPPWNRMAPDLAAALPGLGYAGLSAFAGPAVEAGGIRRIDTHADPVAWRGGRGLADLETFLSDLAARLGHAAADERHGPVGLLTHHLVHDERTWAALDTLIGLLNACPVISWRSAGDIFSVDQRAGKAQPREVQ